MIIEQFVTGLIETNAYVAACQETRKVAIIDPAPDSFEPVVAYLDKNNLKLELILITHSHWDHIGDAAKFKLKFSVPIYIHESDQENLIKPGSDKVPSWVEIEGVQPDRMIKEGDTIQLGKIEFTVIHTPGHTPGGVCFWCKEHNVLFSGDTLFKGSIGNLSLPTSNPLLMWESLDKLAKLPSKTVIYPGHGSSTTIEEEPWLKSAKEIFGY